MHRQIMKAPMGMVVDHIDGNGLNNRRSNPRLCAPQQNRWNRRPSKAREEQGLFKGICHRLGNPKAYALIGHEGKTLHIGGFGTDVEAARAHDRKAVELYGQFACPTSPKTTIDHRDQHRRPIRNARAKPCQTQLPRGQVAARNYCVDVF